MPRRIRRGERRTETWYLNDSSISENEKKEAIEKHKQEIGYVRAVDQELEALSEREKKQMEVELQEDKPKENIF